MPRLSILDTDSTVVVLRQDDRVQMQVRLIDSNAQVIDHEDGRLTIENVRKVEPGTWSFDVEYEYGEPEPPIPPYEGEFVPYVPETAECRNCHRPIRLLNNAVGAGSVHAIRYEHYQGIAGVGARGHRFCYPDDANQHLHPWVAEPRDEDLNRRTSQADDPVTTCRHCQQTIFFRPLEGRWSHDTPYANPEAARGHNAEPYPESAHLARFPLRRDRPEWPKFALCVYCGQRITKSNALGWWTHVRDYAIAGSSLDDCNPHDLTARHITNECKATPPSDSWSQAVRRANDQAKAFNYAQEYPKLVKELKRLQKLEIEYQKMELKWKAAEADKAAAVNAGLKLVDERDLALDRLRLLEDTLAIPRSVKIKGEA